VGIDLFFFLDNWTIPQLGIVRETLGPGGQIPILSWLARVFSGNRPTRIELPLYWRSNLGSVVRPWQAPGQK